MLLQLFIRVINTELLKTVGFKALKTIDVKDSNQAPRVRILPNRDIYFVHQPIKESRVYCLCQTIPANGSTKRIKTSLDNFFWGDHHTLTQSIF
jgi:hypothetical protein